MATGNTQISIKTSGNALDLMNEWLTVLREMSHEEVADIAEKYGAKSAVFLYPMPSIVADVSLDGKELIQEYRLEDGKLAPIKKGKNRQAKRKEA